MKVRKLFSIMLTVSLLTQTTTIYASTGSISVPRSHYFPTGGGKGSVNLSRLAGTYRNWGWRITFGDTRPIVESNIQPLEKGCSKFINDNHDKETV